VKSDLSENKKEWSSMVCLKTKRNDSQQLLFQKLYVVFDRSVAIHQAFGVTSGTSQTHVDASVQLWFQGHKKRVQCGFGGHLATKYQEEWAHYKQDVCKEGEHGTFKHHIHTSN
jgi:hypothetical protein